MATASGSLMMVPVGGIPPTKPTVEGRVPATNAAINYQQHIKQTTPQNQSNSINPAQTPDQDGSNEQIRNEDMNK